MAITHKFPPNFSDNGELAHWYSTTPKWKMAEALREYAILMTGDEKLALKDNFWFKNENGLKWWVERI